MKLNFYGILIIETIDLALDVFLTPNTTHIYISFYS